MNTIRRIRPIKRKSAPPPLTSGQQYAIDALACVLLGFAIAFAIWLAIPQ